MAPSVFLFPIQDSTSAWTADFRIVPAGGAFRDPEGVRERAEHAAAGNRLFDGVIVTDARLISTGLRVAAARASIEPDGSVLLETWTEAGGMAYSGGPGYRSIPQDKLMSFSRMPAARDLTSLLGFEGYGPLDVEVLCAADCPEMPAWVRESMGNAVG